MTSQKEDTMRKSTLDNMLSGKNDTKMNALLPFSLFWFQPMLDEKFWIFVGTLPIKIITTWFHFEEIVKKMWIFVFLIFWIFVIDF